MIALFQGVPQLVILEEPHNGVMFGLHVDNGIDKIYLRDTTGHQVPSHAGRRTRTSPFRSAPPTAASSTSPSCAAASTKP